MNVKLITVNADECEENESYLVWVGYEVTPSGFDIGTYNNEGYFDLQSLPVLISALDTEEVYKITIPI